MENIFVNGSNKIRSIWWIPIFFILLTLFLLPTILIAQKLFVEVSIPLQALLIILVTIICQLLRRESITATTGKFNVGWLEQLFTGLVIGAALMVLPAIILTVSGLVNWQVNNTSYSVILPGLAVFVAVAIVEELLFRGFIFQRLIESFGEWPAQLIIAGMFLLTHIDNPGMAGNILVTASLNIFIASILFGLAYIKTGNLAMPIGIHFMANWVQGTILGFGVSGNEAPGILKPQLVKAPEWLTGGAFGVEASLFGLVILLVVTLAFYSWFPSQIKNRRK